MQYDIARCYTLPTWRDWLYEAFDFELTDEMTDMRVNSATSGTGLIGTHAYGHRGSPAELIAEQRGDQRQRP